MKLSTQQKDTLRWYSAGHNIGMIAQFVSIDEEQVLQILSDLDIEDKWQAERILRESSDVQELVKPDNLPNAGEDVPEFRQGIPSKDKLSKYDKREIAERGGNQVDKIPLSLQQSFRMDIRWRSLSELQHKWLSKVGTEDDLRLAVKEMSKMAYARLYPRDGEENAT